MSRQSNIRKRERQRRRYAQRPKPMDKPAVSTRGLIAELARPISSRALSEAIEELS